MRMQNLKTKLSFNTGLIHDKVLSLMSEEHLTKIYLNTNILSISYLCMSYQVHIWKQKAVWIAISKIML